MLVVCAWVLGAMLAAAHILTGWFQLHRLRSVAAPAPANWVAWLSSRSQQLQVTCPQLLVSTWAGTPMLLGWLRPVIVLPATVLTGRTQEQIEALLTHELVHLRRLDHLVNLLQVLLETLLFYHPAVWRLSTEHDRLQGACVRQLAQGQHGHMAHPLALVLQGFTQLFTTVTDRSRWVATSA